MTLEEMLREFHSGLHVHNGLMPESPTADVPYAVMEARWRLLAEELEELGEAEENGDITKIADGLADAIYVLAGTAVVYGIPLDRVLAEVHRSNMTKTNDPDRAKLIKGPGYSPPNIEEVLNASHDTEEGSPDAEAQRFSSTPPGRSLVP
jgi:predicted HAD superfamily Cof-like phosphohydrolase